MGPYAGDPHDMIARIRHDELLAEAEHHRRLRDLRSRAVPPTPLLQRLRRLAWSTAGPRRRELAGCPEG
ncbi:hypothetical protein [Georgenia sp. SYP-B2076]|uniref:hypothetical protein n=1 Tax=Georgenia sp. SYP-B2076 TaxID=2495881 RepID=UPI000F8C9BFC|nr:hypothetical protein [Georgenia sp. SYP-B2076]